MVKKNRPLARSKKTKATQQDEYLPGVEDFVKETVLELELRPIRYPIWTENKAKFIERYLRYFIFVTKHGTYIDAFAGPQQADKPHMWSAKLVLESEPKRLRHFHLFELSPRKIKQLHKLIESQDPPDKKSRGATRSFQIYAGDFNKNLPALLNSGAIAQKEATFCLLDQRTFECHWSSVEALAEYKTSGSKIELFYFLANSWLRRSLSALKDDETLAKWWGRDDWAKLRQMDAESCQEELVRRFREELRYKSVKAWPIFERPHGRGQKMYFMIHATDHPDAPGLMLRAYENAVTRKEPAKQLELELGYLSDNKEKEEI